jgi:SNF2-related domain
VTIRIIPAEAHPGQLAIDSSSYSPVLREECKRVPGMVWDAPSYLWIGYPDAVQLVAERSKARGLRIGELPLLPREAALFAIAKKDIRDYQAAGVDFLLTKAAEGALLADDLGLGKSLQAIRLARALRARTLVVCPSFVRSVWVEEVAKWWPKHTEVGAGLLLPDGVKETTTLDPSPSIVVIHYDILYAWQEAILEWGPQLMILDEIQYCQNERSRRTQACMAIRQATPYAVGLSGTPMENRPKDFWALSEVLSPGRFGKFFQYALRYCDAQKQQVTPTKAVWIFSGSSNLPELKKRITYTKENPTGFMLRRLKSDVKLQLPARQRQVLDMEIPKSAHVHPGAYGGAMGSDRLLRAALSNAADAKIPQVIELIVNHLEGGAKVVVASHRKAVALAIHEGVLSALPKITNAVLTGEVPIPKRHVLIKSQPDFIACTLDSTGVGINLSFANVGVVAELDYRPSLLTQWEGRFGRQAGQNVLIQYCIAKGSLDEVVKRAVVLKLNTFEGAVGKVDSKLREDLEQITGPNAVNKLKSLYDRLVAEDD